MNFDKEVSFNEKISEEGNGMTVAEQLRAIREKTGLSRARFSELYEIPLRTIEDWETGVRKPPPYVVKMLAVVVEAARLEEFEDD